MAVVSGILGGLSLASGIAGSIFGSSEARKAARERERQLRAERARNNAWYAKAYHEDYLNTAAAQNALKRTRDSWADATREARARQAVTGGTAEQAAAVAQAGGEAMANTVGNLAAQGEKNKMAIDAQKMAMDANIAAQEGAIADARQQAGANLMENGVNLAVSGMSALGDALSPAAAPEMAGIPKTEIPKVEYPKELNVPEIDPLKKYHRAEK